MRPFEVWSRRDLEQDLAHIRSVIDDYAIEEIVLGIPTLLDGQETSATQRARAFADQLRSALDVPVTEWDEALSSFEADERMEEAGIPTKDRKGRRDAFAAMVILEDRLS